MNILIKIIYIILFSIKRFIKTPRIFKIIKALYKNRKTIGELPKIKLNVTLDPRIKLNIGNNVELDNKSRVEIHIHPEQVDLNKSRLILGDNTWIGPEVKLDCSGSLEIGKKCSISRNTEILTHEHLGLNRINEKEVIKDVKIGDNVIIGMNSIISPGVTIGNNSIIGMNSVVTTSFKDNSIVMGNPARLIGKINEEEIKTK